MMISKAKHRTLSIISVLLLLSLLAGCSMVTPEQLGVNESGFDKNSPVYITEIMAQNDTTLADDDGEYSDYIEFYNSTDASVSLKGWYLSDSDKNPRKWQFPDVSIGPKSYLVVYASGKDRNDLEKGIYHTNFSLSSKGETALLLNPDGVFASFIEFSACLPDIPYCRVEEGNDAGSYAWFVQATPGAANTGEYAADINKLTLETVPLYMNEYSMNNLYSYTDSDGDCSDFVEIYNPTDSAVSMTGMSLTDDPEDPQKWHFPSSALIQPKGYLLVFLSGKDKTGENGELHANFRLSVSDLTLQLTDANARKIDAITPEQLSEGLSKGRSKEDLNTWLIFAKPTPGAANAPEGFTDLMSASALINKGVWINEVSAIPLGTNTDNYDWLELYNGTDSAIKLDGYGLSKDPANKFALKFGNVKINAKSYLLVYCAGEEPADPTAGSVYAPFKIGTSGDMIYLTQPDGVVVDAFSTGKLRLGVSSGRVGELGTRYFFSTPTPKAENNRNAYTGYAVMPSASSEGGYAKAGDQLSLNTVSGQTIRYTKDGSDPTEESPLYSEPITLTQTAVIKARAFKDGTLPSDVLSTTFILGTTHDIPIVSLSTDPDNLFDYNKGILANGPGYKEPFPYSGANFWKDWERPITFEYFSADGAKNLQFNAGVKVFGQYTRAYDQKSMSIHLRDQYGTSELNYPLFKDNPVTKIKDMVLRAGGQDQKFTRIRDAFAQQVLKGQTSLVMMDWQPVAVYINGEYWGFFDLREKINEDYLYTHEGIDPDNVDIIKGNSKALSGSNADYLELIDYVKSHDLSNANNYKYVADRVDIDNFIDYLLTEIYFCNGDTGNKKFYKEKKDGAKWRWVMFDFDMTLRVEALWKDENYNMLKLMFNPKGHGHANAFSTALQCALIKNSDFKQKFIRRYAELLNTTFKPDRMQSILEIMKAQVDNEMKKHGERWQRPTYSVWKDEIAGLERIIAKRRDFAKEQFIAYFNLSASMVSELFPNG